MASLTEAVQAQLRAATGKAGQYNEDWHAYADLLGIPAGQWGERVLAAAQAIDPTIKTISAAHYAFLHGTLSISPATANAIVANTAWVPTAAISITDGTGSQNPHYSDSNGAISNLVFTDLWWYISDSFLIGIPTASVACSFKKWVEYPQDTFTPVLYGGSATATMNNSNRQVTSDPVSITIPAGALWWEHTILTNGGATVRSIMELPANASVIGSGHAKYASGGTPSHQASGQASINFFGSSLITGTVAAAGVKSGFIMGDSIVFGQGDVSSVGTKLGSGYLARKMDNLGMSYCKFGKSGMEAADLAGIVATASPTLLNFFALINATNARLIDEFGVNDLRLGRTKAQILADKQTYYGALTIPKVPTTITPRSDSTDSYVTVVNQTAKTDGAMTSLAALNADIRNGLTGTAGFYEVADTAMSARDSGVWRAGPQIAFAPVLDGTHPVSQMAQYIADNTTLTLP